jgi:uncharacterized membrane protein (UPF0182 family)
VSGMFEDEEPVAPRQAPPQPPGRSRSLLITAGVLVALFIAMTLFTSLWTERLWFVSHGFEDVFLKLFGTRLLLFTVFGLAMALVVGLNMMLAYRFRPIFRPASPEQVSLDRYRDAVLPVRLWLVVGVSLVMGTFAGASATGKWREFLLWRNGVSFDSTDPYFDRDIGYYVFELPWQHYMVDFAMAVTVVSILAAALVHYLFGGIRLQSRQDRLSGPAAAQLSALVGVFVLLKAADYWLDRYDLLNGGGALITGITYTDDHAVLPAKNILTFIALICALLLFANLVQRTWLLPSVGLALLVLSAILLGMIWPGIVQQFQVNPSEADREAPYIKRNIDATRTAYNLEDAIVTPYSGQSTLTPQQRAQEASTLPGIRLVDPQLIRATYEQQQQVRRYYSVAPVLDVDRYEVNGQERDVVIGVRELDQSGLPAESQNWSNLRTVYTHGYGVIAAYGNQRDSDNAERSLPGDPVYADTLQQQSALAPEGYREQVYFGEMSPEYSIVGKRSEDAPDVELDQPDAEDEDSTSTYDGGAGVPIGGLFNQLLYSWKFGEPNIVLSGRVNGNSKILYDRDPRQMVEKVAPWLTVDADPFPAVVDGKIVWLVDGYTTTDQYPLSERGSFRDMTSDALDTQNEFRTLPTDEINYMRNAVKAVVDAYDGTVTLYAWDESDPMLQAWRDAFPGTVQDRDEISTELLEHMRYPEDMFKVQRFQLAQYHVTDSQTFYEQNERWEVPEDPNTRGRLQPPYRLSVRTQDSGPVFSLTSVYTPFNKQNLAAFVSVDSDASKEGYGTLRVLELPTSGPVQGPAQIANEFTTNSVIQQALVPLTRTNARAVYGNLLTLPVGDSLLYVQPLYAVREATEGVGTFPVLNYVLVSFGDKSGIGRTLTQAVADVLGVSAEGPSQQPPGEQEPPGQQPPGEQPSGPLPERVLNELRLADREFANAQRALADGDLQGYADATERAQRHVAAAIAAAEEAGEAGEEPPEEPSE